MDNLKVFLLSSAMVLSFGVAALAQESAPAEQAALEAINLDENIQPEDLGVGEPTILPDSPFYFLKNWGRGIQSFFTFNPVAKSELKEKFASEKLLELKKIIEQKKSQEVIKKAAENYQKGIEEMKKTAEAIKQKARESPEVDKFLNKFISQQILHQKLLQKLEEQVPSEAFKKIKENRERHLEGFQSIMLKLEDRQDKITEKLNEALEEQKGSEFKDFKNLEVLKNLEEKVPEQAKEAIQKAQENSLKRLQGDLGKISSEGQERLKEYLDKISGNKERHLEILEDVKSGIKKMPESIETLQLQKKLEESKSGILEKISEEARQIGCPAWSKPATSDFCKGGRIVFGPDIQGCPSQPLCVILGDTTITPGTGTNIASPTTGVTPPYIPPSTGVGRACITLWDPVCGKDGKTYSNECFAELAKVEIDYKGACRVPPDTGIPEVPPVGTKPPEPIFCAQVITPAIGPEGVCKEFPTPCDVPDGWKEIAECPSSIKTPTY